MRVQIKKNTDQWNFEDFLGGVTRMFTIAGVTDGKAEAQYDISFAEDKRVWRPPATVLKQLVTAWGDEAEKWTGRMVDLYGDPDVKMMGETVGGIRLRRLSHIDGPITQRLTTTRGKRGNFTVHPIPPVECQIHALGNEYRSATPERQAEIVAEVKTLKGQS